MFSSFLSYMGIAQSASFPYVIGEPNQSFVGKSIWALHSATRKDDNSPVSVFSFDCKKNPDKVELAKNAFRRSRTLRHPSILGYVDGVEIGDQYIYIVTELVSPLEEKLQEIKEHPQSISWGIYQLVKVIGFINDAHFIHGMIGVNSVFVNKAGDFKLGCLDLLSEQKTLTPLKNFPDLVDKKYKPPELVKSDWAIVQEAPSYAIDTWMTGCLVYEIYNGKFTKQEELKQFGQIPKTLQSEYPKLFSGNPSSRISPSSLLESKYFQNSYIETCLFLENFAIKEAYEKDNFFRKLDKLLDEFSITACKYKILPHLITAVDYGSANPKILGPLLKIGGQLTQAEYAQKVTPSVVKWFGSNDRSLRINLLENLEYFASHLTPTLVNDQIFPNIVNGFTDVSPVLREATVKSMLLLAPKLNEKTINAQMLKYFAKLQMDQEPGIRTNTTICLGKIAQHLSDATRKRVLVPAFSRSLRDPFPHARIAGLMAFVATQEYYDREDVAVRVIPSVSPLLVDMEKQVRTQASQCVKIFMKRIQKLCEDMENNPSGNTANATEGSVLPNIANINIGTDAGVLGWAFNSLTKKVYGSGENDTGSITKGPKTDEKPNANTNTNNTPIVSPPNTNTSSNARDQPKPNKSKSVDGWDDENEEEIEVQPRKKTGSLGGWDEDDDWNSNDTNNNNNYNSNNNNTNNRFSNNNSNNNTSYGTPPKSSNNSSSNRAKSSTNGWDEENDDWGDFSSNDKKSAKQPSKIGVQKEKEKEKEVEKEEKSSTGLTKFEQAQLKKQEQEAKKAQKVRPSTPTSSLTLDKTEKPTEKSVEKSSALKLGSTKKPVSSDGWDEDDAW